ncbi:MAG: DUF502 domain-containing protein [Nitrospirae bacterium]|nr:MAG: DUF502 domain-containing protein [Nitrospirota bacterium]
MALLRSLRRQLRATFLTGLAVLVPLLVTFFVLKAVVGGLDRVVGGLPARYLGVRVPGLGVVLLLLLVLAVGALSRNFLGRRLVAWWEGLLANIPVVRPVYKGAREVVRAVVGSGAQQFSRVVLVEYPKAGSWAVAFVTGSARGALAAPLTGPHLTVFLPTTPNPTSGFLLVVPEAAVRPLELSVEEAMKVVISAGLVLSEAGGGAAPVPGAAADR